MFDKISVRLRLAFEFLKVLPLIVFAVRLREVVFLISRVFADKDSLGGLPPATGRTDGAATRARAPDACVERGPFGAARERDGFTESEIVFETDFLIESFATTFSFFFPAII